MEKKCKKFISCKNTQCHFNKSYNKENREENEMICTKLTECDLTNKIFCEEREF